MPRNVLQSLLQTGIENHKTHWAGRGEQHRNVTDYPRSCIPACMDSDAPFAHMPEYRRAYGRHMGPAFYFSTEGIRAQITLGVH